jgi:Secretion system C-terminal sorting domain
VDACDPDFAAATGWSGDVSYLGGPFAGWTVSAVIEAANQFIGGCGSGGFTAVEYNEALTLFNENYLGGTVDNGNFLCEKKDDKKMMKGEATNKTVIYPNPASVGFTLEVDLQNAGSGTLFVHDVTGRVVVEQAIVASEAGSRRIPVSVEGLGNGTYTVALVFNGRITTERIVVSK